MLFNSYDFILKFLPVVLVVCFALGHAGRSRIALAWLVAASLFFYGWWNPPYLVLIVASILFNWVVGRGLSAAERHRRVLLGVGIACNLALLGYFKYAAFFVQNASGLIGMPLELRHIELPLAISFFTFQQIAYLVDAYRSAAGERDLLRYGFFVAFFPQLIAGPIVHHSEVLPQTAVPGAFRFRHEHVAVGSTMFVIGLAKKVLIADSLSRVAVPVFDTAARGAPLSFAEVWVGVLAYAFQIYFDFSGYSDMAVGLGRLVGIRLPVNFNSPYKAVTAVEFWRRWHMTLSRFLRDYLYIPLGGSRHGTARRYVNLMVTMLLGGLWHGAGWPFVLWGGLHGLYLVVNHAWRLVVDRLGLTFTGSRWWRLGVARPLTFLAVLLGWVLFRAADLRVAGSMFGTMIGRDGFGTVLRPPFGGEHATQTVLWLVALFAVVWGLPNSQELLSRHNPVFEPVPDSKHWLRWGPNGTWAVIIAAVGLACLLHMDQISEFLYFQF